VILQVVTYKTTRHHNQEDHVQYLNCRENLKAPTLKICPIRLLSKQIPHGFPDCKCCNKKYVLKCFYYESEPTNNEELKIDTVSGTPEALDEVCKTIGRPRSCNTQGPLTNHGQLQKLDEIALIKAVLEKMGHEVRLSVQAILHTQVFSFYF
jgi:hypothetical protein